MIWLVLLVSCVCFHIGYGLWFYTFLEKNWKDGNHNVNQVNYENSPSVSLIISAKNEADNLQKHLSKILTQQYPNFEVLVVDDHSTDHTLTVLKKFKEKHPHLKIVEATHFKDLPGKKAALTAAIKMAQHEILLFTDADCFPNSPFWIKKMAARFTNDIDIVLGYGPYRKTKGWLNKFIRFETTLTALNYFSFALRGMPYMGVGRNMAYRKNVFNKANGYTKHKHIASGDDDLFISQVATPTNVALSIHPDSWCYSEAKKSWPAYIKQKNRHVSTSTSYKKNIQLLLGFYALTHILMFILLIYFAFFKLFLITSVCTLLFKILSQYYLYHYLFIRLGVKDLRCYIPILDFMMLGYYFFSFPGVMGVTSLKNNTWQ